MTKAGIAGSLSDRDSTESDRSKTDPALRGSKTLNGMLGSAADELLDAATLSELPKDDSMFYTEPGELASLEQREQRYALAMLGANDGLWDWSIDTDKVYVSHRAEVILNIRAEDIAGSSWALVQRIHPDDLTNFRSKLMAHIKGQTDSFVAEYRIEDKDGNIHWVLHRGVALRDHTGRARRMAGSLSDITDRKTVELSLIDAKRQAEAAAKAKSDFLAHMSHELRTPLNAIIGFANMMESEVMGPLNNPTYKEYADHIGRSGRHLLTLINDVLDTAKVESGTFALRDEVFDPVYAVREAMDLMRPRADRTHVRLRLRIRAPMAKLLADPVRVRQVFLNILSNAVKFSPDHGQVDIILRLSQARGMTVLIADQGPGMEPRDVPRVLETFGQVNNLTTRHMEGTGLGLPLSKKLMELHDGTLDIDTAPRKGTRVLLSFPLHRVVIG